MPHRTTALLWRALLAAGLVCAVGLLPWLSHTDPALTVLKARSAERDPDPEVLTAIRSQIGLDEGPLGLLAQWLGGLPHGDAGRSWISGTEVMPAVLQALGASLLLMTTALAVAVATAGAVCAGTLRRGGRAVGQSGGSGCAGRAVFPGSFGRRSGGDRAAPRAALLAFLGRGHADRRAERPGGGGGVVRAALPGGLAEGRVGRPVGRSGDGEVGGAAGAVLSGVLAERQSGRSAGRSDDGGGGVVRAVLSWGLARRRNGRSAGRSGEGEVGGVVRAALPGVLAEQRSGRSTGRSDEGGRNGGGNGAVLGAPPGRLGRRRADRPASHPGGTASAALAALPEFLTASVLATVVGVQLGWLPALGWFGPRWTVLPALALGLPAGAVLGRLLDDLLPGAFAELWARAAVARGLPGRRIARHAVRRCLPGLLPNLGLFVVGLTGGAVAVEQVFDIPGLGRTTLQAALAQDLPVLQAGTLLLLLLAALAAGLCRLAARLLAGPALRAGVLPSLHGPAPTPRRIPPLVYGALLLGVLALGLPRDPLALNTGLRLQHPTWAHPFGTDALGRDLLARIAHGAVDTLVLALGISCVALVAGVLLGLLPRLSGPLVDTVNAVPPVLAALLVTAVAGSGSGTPALAVALLAWTPLAAHTSALLRQERATLHVTATRGLGAGRWYLLRRSLLPAVLPPVTRHALLRLPGVALALASLGFLGLGAQPPSPEWGLLLAENQPYAERAPWAVLAPAAVLALLGALAVTAAGSLRAAGQGKSAAR
ncbi:ABC-type dipeptide/oligopeptide/nickel transport system, permease component [Streptomyces sp. 3213]|uniref:ABC transporter permease subunit n=1 Tax=Streptomyces sp. 3213.3 TaxID=1855348 RepID=UPI000895D93B|nr:ABC transporter permease subunit [Streptomyces sp. 3213.3]SEE76787.1 ABC-type dipeptide/oligopeptide/nickel transport system, permease component [Streptomyces sp. 3213] [Streptomyces sp. 3213.3]